MAPLHKFLLNIPYFFIISIFFQEYVCHYIRTHIDRLADGHEIYTARVNIGTPSLEYKLIISFDHDKIIMNTDLSRISATYLPDFGGSDFISIGKDFHRLPMAIGGVYEIIKNSGCFDCSGIFGVSRGSAISVLYPEISFSRNFMTLGKIGDEIGWNSKETLSVLKCEEGIGLCQFYSEIKIGNKTFSNEHISIDPMIQDITLNPRIYDEYTRGKNIYNDNIHNWEHLQISAKSLETNDEAEIYKYQLEKFEKKFGIKKENYHTSLELEIKPEHLVKTTRNNGKFMNLKKGTRGTTIIGTEAMKHMIFHKSYVSNVVIVQLFETNDNSQGVSLALFIVQVILLARWFVTHIPMYYSDDIHDRRDLFETFYEIAGIAITITAYVLPSTLELVETHMSLYIGTGFLVGFAFLWNIISWLIDIFNRYRRKKKKKEYHLFGERFQENLTRAFSHEVLLLTGIWLLVLERRIENVSDGLILFVNIVLVFDMSFHLVIMIIYMTWYFFNSFDMKKYTKNVMFKDSVASFFVFFFMAFVSFTYQSIVSFNFFARPLLVKNYETYERYIVPGLVFLYIFILTAASYIAYLILGHSLEKANKKVKI